MQVQTLDATVVNTINEMKATYERQIKEIQTHYEHEIHKIKIEAVAYQHKYLEIKERSDGLIYKRFERSAEQLLSNDNQQVLFTTETVEPEATAEAEPEILVPSYHRKKPGRKPLDPNLPRRERIIAIPEREKTCACGAKLTRIGEATSEILHIIPPQVYVERIIRPTYACLSCEGTEDEDTAAVRIAPVEPTIIPRGIASPSLLSTVFTYKFERHLPYYRQEQLYQQGGADVSRQDMSNWQQQVYKKLSPLFELLKQMVKSGPVLQMDETTVQVIGEAKRSDTQNSYRWLARGGPKGKTVLWYEYHPTRAAYNASSFLQGYAGYLQTDGYEGYDSAVKDKPAIIHVGCFAHARRKCFEASKASKANRSAEEGIKHIRKLYVLEDELRSRDLKDTVLVTERNARAGPILEQFKGWLAKRQDEVPPSMLLGKAIHYSLRQWDKMIAYLESPYLTPDNNACENAIRPFVLGRKNWLFSQSPDGAESSCGMFTLIETAKQNGLVPFKYLMALFEQAPLACTSKDWEKLLPWNIFTA